MLLKWKVMKGLLKWLRIVICHMKYKYKNKVMLFWENQDIETDNNKKYNKIIRYTETRYRIRLQ